MKLRQNRESVKAYIKRTLAIKEEVNHPTYLMGYEMKAFK
jgi:hypothetical protein